MYVLCAGQNLHRLAALTIIHHAHPQMVRIGVTGNFHDLAGNNALQALAQLGYSVYFQANASNLVAQLFGRDVNIYILF